VKTIHSTLGFFDVESLRNSRDKGTLRKNLKRLRKKFKRIIIDESSMLHSEVFEILVTACDEVGMGIVLTGDFLQLLAVQPDPKPKGYIPWLFQTPAWKKFKDHVIRLDTQYRHTNENFLKALNLLRAGKGEEAIPFLKKAGVRFVPGGDNYPLDLNFKGTTLVGTNNMCDKINAACYAKIHSDEHTYTTWRKGVWTKKDWQEWGDIPGSVSLKIGTRAMVLRNLYGQMVLDPNKTVDTDALDIQPVLFNPDGSLGFVKKEKKNGEGQISEPGSDEADENKGEIISHALLQANGDTGVIESIGGDEFGLTFVEVRRDDGALIRVEMFTADNGKYHTEIGDKGQRIRITDEQPTAWVTYLPLKRAWAVTTHKAQGLTISHPTRIVLEDFFRRPAMIYVACSRVKNPTDLTIVGADFPVNGKPWLHWLCKTDPAVSEWIGGNYE